MNDDIWDEKPIRATRLGVSKVKEGEENPESLPVQSIKLTRIDGIDSQDPMLRVAIRHLYDWKMHGGDNFHSLLYQLIAKADPTNRARFAKGFPYEMRAYVDWQESPDEAEFFRSRGC